MKNVLLLVHDDAGQESRLQAALDLTRGLGGHLVCLGVAIIPFIVSDVYAFTVEQVVFADEQARESENRRRIEARLANEDVPWSWIETTGSAAQALEAQAGMADVIVASRKLDSDSLPDMQAIASEVVIGSGRTVVAVPESSNGFDVAGHAMVAWDGSEQAASALQAAVPLLKLARTVTLVEVLDGTSGRAAEEAAAYLSRHGVKAVIVRRRRRSLATADTLLAEAKAEGAGYIVMGAFGRSRLVEAILGGVSRKMLSESPVPVVMAH